jgi:hypothetical protein
MLSDEHVALIATVADELSQTLPGYAPKPLNMKKPVDKELQVSYLKGMLSWDTLDERIFCC